MAFPKTEDVIGYLNYDIWRMQQTGIKIEQACKKEPMTCGGCREMQNLSQAIDSYQRVVSILKLKQNSVEVEMNV